MLLYCEYVTTSILSSNKFSLGKGKFIQVCLSIKFESSEVNLQTEYLRILFHLQCRSST